MYIIYFSCGHSACAARQPRDSAWVTCPTCRTLQEVLITRPAGNGVPAAVVPQLASVTRANAYIDRIIAKTRRDS